MKRSFLPVLVLLVSLSLSATTVSCHQVITVTPPPPPTIQPLAITANPAVSMPAGSGFMIALNITGGVAPYTCALGTGAPTWVTATVDNTGPWCKLTGNVPLTQTVGDVGFDVSVTDSAKATAVMEFTTPAK
jgi:hypothetical protein